MIKKLRRSYILVIGALLLVLTVSATQSKAEVNVNIGVNLPVIRFAAPPAVVVIPGTYVYMVPDIDADFLFFQGYWWRPYEGRWYRSRDYQGGWSYVAPERIPPGLRGMPQDYRNRIRPEHERIPHGDLQKNWKKWEKDKHWDRQGKQKDRGERSDHDSRGHGEQDRGDRGDRDRGDHGDRH